MAAPRFQIRRACKMGAMEQNTANHVVIVSASAKVSITERDQLSPYLSLRVRSLPCAQTQPRRHCDLQDSHLGAVFGAAVGVCQSRPALVIPAEPSSIAAVMHDRRLRYTYGNFPTLVHIADLRIDQAAVAAIALQQFRRPSRISISCL